MPHHGRAVALALALAIAPLAVATPAESVVITSVSLKNLNEGQWELDLSGTGFNSGCVVHLARWTNLREWLYFSAALPSAASASRLTVRTAELTPGDYIAVIRDADGSVSAPSSFAIRGGGQAHAYAYGMPTGRGEQWVVTQRPNGGFSHWNRSQNAWDLAPAQGRFVVAMRAGIAHTYDRGLGRTVSVRSFGNYISIDHGDGEYSHYAHLASGSFLVADGEHVDQGQRLARVGNSGYTLGPGGGYHVHVHVTRSASIAAQSIPFEFDRERESKTMNAGTLHGSVQVAQWWSEFVRVSPQADFSVLVKPNQPDTALALHLVSPSGIHYAPDGLVYAQPKPEPGIWRIAIEGMRGGPEPITFTVEAQLTKAKAPWDNLGALAN